MVPDEVREDFRQGIGHRGKMLRDSWFAKFEDYRTRCPELADHLYQMQTRQNLPTLDRNKYAPASGVGQGAYILADVEDGQPDVLLLASGSEVHLCVAAHEQLRAEGTKACVISMPSWELFEQQDQDYKDSVILPEVTAGVAVEQASTLGWERYTGLRGHVIGMHTFGASAPLKALQRGGRRWSKRKDCTLWMLAPAAACGALPKATA